MSGSELTICFSAGLPPFKQVQDQRAFVFLIFLGLVSSSSRIGAKDPHHSSSGLRRTANSSEKPPTPKQCNEKHQLRKHMQTHQPIFRKTDS